MRIFKKLIIQMKSILQGHLSSNDTRVTQTIQVHYSGIQRNIKLFARLFVIKDEHFSKVRKIGT